MNEVPSVYHFTDASNWESIRQHGLLSWHDLVSRGIRHVRGSSDLSRRLDGAKFLTEYIHLAIRPDHPMAYHALKEGRIQDLIWLAVDPVVLKGARFSDCNATSTGAIINSNFNTAFKSGNAQAEILVKWRIKPDLIRRL